MASRAASEALQALAYAGVGSGAGAVVAAIISARSGKGAARAEAADLLTEAAERVSHMNQELDKENRHLRHELSEITHAIQCFLDKEIDERELRETISDIRASSM